MMQDTPDILAEFQRISQELQTLRQSDPQKYIEICDALTEEMTKLSDELAKP